jgi:hypothetical protein
MELPVMLYLKIHTIQFANHSGQYPGSSSLKPLASILCFGIFFATVPPIILLLNDNKQAFLNTFSSQGDSLHQVTFTRYCFIHLRAGNQKLNSHRGKTLE